MRPAYKTNQELGNPNQKVKQRKHSRSSRNPRSSRQSQSQNEMDAAEANENRASSNNEPSDRMSIATLFFLYLLQGLPMGLVAGIPMILQNRGISYRQQASFSIVYWPFSLKVLWAPIVDSIFCRRIGRRKTWIIPLQYIIGSLMIFMSLRVDDWLGNDSQEPIIPLLTASFFVLNIFLATQDIAVDGWSISLLKTTNKSYASTCNSAGQTTGFFLGYVTFITMESKEFCNTFLRSEPKDVGMLTLSQFLFCWGLIMIIIITIVAIFQKESKNEEERPGQQVNSSTSGLWQCYKVLFGILKLRSFQTLGLILLTVRFTFAPHEAVTHLKLIDAGVQRDKLALLVIPVLLVQTFLPVIVGHYIQKTSALNVYIKIVPYRMLSATICVIIASFSSVLVHDDHYSVYFYILLVFFNGFYQILVTSMFVATTALFGSISNPANGGTYMTFLHTLNNLGRAWPNTVALWFIDILTVKNCSASGSRSLPVSFCMTQRQRDQCLAAGGQCIVGIDGYYFEVILCSIYGLVWLYFATKMIENLQRLPKQSWLPSQRSSSHNLDIG